MYKAAVLTVSDRCSRGERRDEAGPLTASLLAEAGYLVTETAVVPDEQPAIEEALIRLADREHTALVVTTGGTGFSPEDCTPEATTEILERPALGIPEAMRAHMLKASPLGVLTRATAGIRKKTLIVNLPGTPDIAQQCLAYILPFLKLGIQTMNETT